jgi:hypothetical protein
MKRALICAAFVLLAIPSFAQTVANGPYYAVPSWDQTLPVAQRFIVLANFAQEAVLDRETGLVWERAPSASTFPSWFIASRLCISSEVGGRLGWRLPTVQEISSLMDPTILSGVPNLPVSHPFVFGTDLDFWTGTASDEGSTPSAYFVRMSNVVGRLSVGPKASSGVRKWCVRSSQGIDVQ